MHPAWFSLTAAVCLQQPLMSVMAAAMALAARLVREDIIASRADIARAKAKAKLKIKNAKVKTRIFAVRLHFCILHL